jgi:uroporphyrinogen III methyltransferase/synthase
LAGFFESSKDYDWLILTSPNGARFFCEALWASGRDARALSGTRIAVIGPGTAEALRPFGLRPDLTPNEYVAEGLLAAFEGLDENIGGLGGEPGGRGGEPGGRGGEPGGLGGEPGGLGEKPRRRVLLARAETAREVLPEGLTKLGYEVEVAPLYRTVPAAWGDSFVAGLLSDPPDLTTLTSTSTAEGLAALIPEKDRYRLPCASIGPVTTSAARALGFTIAVESGEATIGALVEAARGHLGGRR